jgi:hypothetical protein
MLAALGTVALAEEARGATLVRGPYLQLLKSSSVTVVWRTDVPAACSLAIRPLIGATIVIDGGADSECVIPVDGLVAGVPYAYVPRADGVALAPQAIFTPPTPTQAFSFLVLGDSGSGGTGQLRVRDRMLATPANFLLHTGDMVYEDGEAENYDRKYFDPYRLLLRRLVLWPCLGNHDVRTAGGGPWRDAFHTPANNPAGSENYYSFDFGNAHVVVLDTNRSTNPGSAQHLFLAQDLGASTATWKFVAFHHSVYSSGRHGSDLQIRANLVPLFEQHDVDVVFMGHDHHYERTHPLLADLPVEPGLGTVYITTGGGGAELYEIGTSAFTAAVESAFHYTRVRVDGTTLLAQMIRDDGTIGDSVVLTKEGSPPSPRCGDLLVNQVTEECDGPDHPACLGSCRSDCTCAAACGDGVVNQPSEDCEAGDDDACPGLCLSDCSCGNGSQVMTLAPVADTYVEEGAEASWDHGAADRINADTSPTSIAFLKFDLSGIARTVSRATLTLHCINASINDVTLYPVADSSWIEGTGTGIDATSALGPGLKWLDLDTNLDGRLDAGDGSPHVPDFTRWIAPTSCVLGQTSTVDVTAAFQTPAPLVSLAIAHDVSDGAHFSSREALAENQRPRLRVELGAPIATTTTVTTSTSTTTSTTSTTSSTSITVTTTTTTSTSTSTSTTTMPTTTSTSTSTSTTTTSSTASTTTSTSSTSSTSSSTTDTKPTTTSTTSTTSSTTDTQPTTTSTTSTTSSTTDTQPTTTSTTSTTSSTTDTRPTSTTTGPTTTSTTLPGTTSSTTTSTTTTSSPTTTRPDEPCDVTACDDGDPCTVDRCVATGCGYQDAEGFAAVRCMFEGSRLDPPPCASQRVADAVTRGFARAQTLVDRASAAPRPRKAKVRLRKAIRILRTAARVVRRGDLPGECALALVEMLDEARLRAERLVRTL